jgi:predicted GIY-YIG superfamily endonuclease
MLTCLKRTFCCSRKIERNKRPLPEQNVDGKETYVLKLLNDKYYVGESNNVKRRIWAHSNDNGSAWTKRYGVERKMECIPCTSNLHELVQTLEMMKEYGIDNVRGSMFTKPFPLDPSEKIMAAQLYCELHNLCRRCGSNEHFIGVACPLDGKMAEWVQQFGGRLEMNTEDSKRECLECQTGISKLPPNFKYCRSCFMKVNGYNK